MIILKSHEEIEKMRAANRISAEVLLRLQELLEPGITTLDLDRLAEEMVVKLGGTPAFKGYMGYRHTLCVAPNDVIVHGIPNEVPLKEGDILGIDCGVCLDGFYGDHARTFPVGTVSKEAADLLAVGEAAMMQGIAKAAPDFRLFDIGAAVQSYAEGFGYSVVRDYVGHGVGRSLHEEPQVPNYGTPGTGMRLRTGMVLAIEPMINQGTAEGRVLADGWTVVTKDNKLSVHFEHSVAITEKGPEILSLL